MPRKSAASLAVVPITSGLTPITLRPEPPRHLPKTAAAIWREVTAARPAPYFDAASLPLLESYARSLAEHRRIMTMVEKMAPTDPDFAKLSRVADMHAGRVSQLATRMRLSHQSRTDSRKAGRSVGDHREHADRVRAGYAEGA